MPPVAFEPAIPVSQRQHTDALESAATGIGYESSHRNSITLRSMFAFVYIWWREKVIRDG